MSGLGASGVGQSTTCCWPGSQARGRIKSGFDSRLHTALSPFRVGWRHGISADRGHLGVLNTHTMATVTAFETLASTAQLSVVRCLAVCLWSVDLPLPLHHPLLRNQVTLCLSLCLSLSLSLSIIRFTTFGTGGLGLKMLAYASIRDGALLLALHCVGHQPGPVLGRRRPRPRLIP